MELLLHVLTYNFSLKKYCSGVVEGVDLIFRIVCQVSDQDNIVTKSKNHIGSFGSKSFVPVIFVVLIGAKSYCRNICFNKAFVCNRHFNNCANKLCRSLNEN